jgi:hypothetical protein
MNAIVRDPVLELGSSAVVRMSAADGYPRVDDSELTRDGHFDDDAAAAARSSSRAVGLCA